MSETRECRGCGGTGRSRSRCIDCFARRDGSTCNCSCHRCSVCGGSGEVEAKPEAVAVRVSLVGEAPHYEGEQTGRVPRGEA